MLILNPKLVEVRRNEPPSQNPGRLHPELCNPGLNQTLAKINRDLSSWWAKERHVSKSTHMTHDRAGPATRLLSRFPSRPVRCVRRRERVASTQLPACRLGLWPVM